MKCLSSQYFASGDTLMLLIVLGISVFAAVSSVLLIAYVRFDVKKDYLYDETDSFDQRRFERWHL
jgi:hypothetical protein